MEFYKVRVVQMPTFPNPRQFTAMLQGYKDFREPTWGSSWSYIRECTGRDDRKVKTNQCNNINSLFYDGKETKSKLNEFDGAVNALFVISQYGHDGYSILSFVANAIRCKILFGFIKP